MPLSRWLINSAVTPDCDAAYAWIGSASGTLEDGAQTWRCLVSDSWLDHELTVELLDAAAILQARQGVEEHRVVEVKATAAQQLGSVPAVRISGSPKTEDNGVYLQRADHDGMPRYEKEDDGGRHLTTTC